MKWAKWLENWDMANLKISAPFMEMEWQPNPADKNAAWEMYIELITRVSTQKLMPNEGDEKSALDSIYQIFSITRDILKRYKRDCMEFARISIIMLNNVLRPFTTKWHCLIHDNSHNEQFRHELNELQSRVSIYVKMLAQMAEADDLINL